jgi:hypothetical protein
MIEIKNLNYINLVDFKNILDDHEIGLGDKFWDHLVDKRHGNQTFTNDTFCIYHVGAIDPEMDGVYQIKGLTRVEADTIFSFLKDVPTFEPESILFEVSW